MFTIQICYKHLTVCLIYFCSLISNWTFLIRSINDAAMIKNSTFVKNKNSVHIIVHRCYFLNSVIVMLIVGIVKRNNTFIKSIAYPFLSFIYSIVACILLNRALTLFYRAWILFYRWSCKNNVSDADILLNLIHWIECRRVDKIINTFIHYLHPVSNYQPLLRNSEVFHKTILNHFNDIVSSSLRLSQHITVCIALF